MMNNSSYTNDTNGTIDPIHLPEIQFFFIVIYITIFVLGIFGNVLTCYVVFANRSLQTVTNFFITNLAFADILLCALSVPVTPLYFYLGKWYFGSVLCHGLPYSQGTSVYVSTLTLTSIAVDRFIVIIYPFRQRMKTTTCFYIINLIWYVSMIATLPYGIYMKMSDDEACDEDWTAENIRRAFGSATAILQFVIPFIIITFCYLKVSLKLKDRVRFKPGAKNSRREEAERERNRRTNRMLIAMVSIFGISWLPLTAVNLINDFWPDITGWKYYNLAFFFCHSLAMSSTCYNPFLYAWLNENFRKEFKQVLSSLNSTAATAIVSERAEGWRSEKTCNGNETMQESLLQSTTILRRCSSIRMQTDDATRELRERMESVDVEDIMVPKATYEPNKEEVVLHLLHLGNSKMLLETVEERSSSPVPKGETDSMLIGSVVDELV